MCVGYANHSYGMAILGWFVGCATEPEKGGVDDLDEESKRRIEDAIEDGGRIPDHGTARPWPL